MSNEQYYFPLDRFMSVEHFERIKRFAAGKPSPCLIIDLDVVRARFTELQALMPKACIYYAVKANPHDAVLAALAELGSFFDIASRYELDQCLRLGITPDRLSFGNPIKKRVDIEYAYGKGVRLFVTDSDEDLDALAERAPGSRIVFRLLTEGTGSDWPLSRKFGAHPDTVYSLVLRARDLGLDPYGLTFHVGSQQRDIGQWDDAISKCRYLVDSLRPEGVRIRMLNLGGGLPGTYTDATLPTKVYTSEIKRFLYEDFGDEELDIFVEPGRYLAADSGVIVSEVVRLSKKSRNNQYRWMYLDVGKFSGLIETLDEAIKFPIYFEKKGESEPVIIAGPTCDSMDILYEKTRYSVPSTVTTGDIAYILGAGAYTQSYSSVNFNGFPPLEAFILE
ncbi:MAG: type III PLP-dependent enzyme [Spirochaetaceae bacterium]|nr:MAG: type III PLP-dependent enzyme [Spirochaetaceae bacterium]